MRMYRNSSEFKKNLPVLVVLIMSALFGLILVQEVKYEVSSEKINAQKDLQLVSVSLSELISKPIDRLQGLKFFFEENPDFESIALEKMAARIFDNFGKLAKTVAITDAGVIKFIYPLKGNEQVIGIDLLKVKSQKVQTAKVFQTGENTLLGPLKVLQDWKALIHLSPIYANSSNSNQVTGLMTLTINDEELFKESGISRLIETHYVKITNIQQDLEENAIIDTTEGKSYDFINMDIYPVDQHWKISIYPKGGWEIRYEVMVFLVILWVTMTGLLTAFTLWLLKKNAFLENAVIERTKTLVDTNDYLENSLAENEEKQAMLEIMNEKLEKNIIELRYSQERVVSLEKIRVINDMMNGIAHQLNTPLGNIKLMLSYVKSIFESSQTSDHLIHQEWAQSLSDSLDIIENSTDKAIRIVSNFQTISFLNLNQKLEPIIICNFINDLITESMDEHYIRFINSVPETVVIVCNKSLLKQVISNIVIFFSEFADREKNCDIVFDFVTINEITALQIHVLNNNIPDDFTKKIFDPHLMVPSRKLTGLELFMSHFVAVKLLSFELKYNYEGQDCHLFMLYLTQILDEEGSH
ncbi:MULTISPECIES: CHASE domain-containing protein [unclassified Fusibacter]|uniref:CHASE domain-containing protein n=1 Tax=unclassified Fusibacter TaxID=2624464 RepID=UPI0010133EFF|nr:MULTISPECIES: CHASE domain-containing protein [unclassified Fusibacter]MCK8058124.1 CHASE domain-containing protein [Fusibacter sp. A2]NPE20706.1 hypothetical protein [Fusibacter sp. A1]RXV62911.1 hypothetical protein DWB64_02650 [Fusibacter sp. A1]